MCPQPTLTKFLLRCPFLASLFLTSIFFAGVFPADLVPTILILMGLFLTDLTFAGVCAADGFRITPFLFILQQKQYAIRFSRMALSFGSLETFIKERHCYLPTFFTFYILTLSNKHRPKTVIPRNTEQQFTGTGDFYRLHPRSRVDCSRYLVRGSPNSRPKSQSRYFPPSSNQRIFHLGRRFAESTTSLLGLHSLQALSPIRDTQNMDKICALHLATKEGMRGTETKTKTKKRKEFVIKLS